MFSDQLWKYEPSYKDVSRVKRERFSRGNNITNRRAIRIIKKKKWLLVIFRKSAFYLSHVVIFLADKFDTYIILST